MNSLDFFDHLLDQIMNTSENDIASVCMAQFIVHLESMQ